MDGSWEEILRDTTRYPDTMTLDLGDNRGVVRLGDLRAAMVPKSEVQQWQQRAQIYADEKRALERQLAQVLMTVPTGGASAPAAAPPAAPEPSRPPIDYTADPILHPLYQTASEAHKMAQETQQALAEMRKLLEQQSRFLHELPNAFVQGSLKQQDPSLDIDALNRYRQQHGIRDPLVAYKALTYEQAIAKARADGEAAALEKAKAELAQQGPQVPFAPYGPPQTLTLPQPSFRSIDEAEHAAVRDPEILTAFFQPASA